MRRYNRPVEFAGPVLDVVLPVYGLIAAGWAAARLGAIAAADLPRFTHLTFVLFVPAQLFLAMARADFSDPQPGVPGAYFTTAFIAFGAVLLLRRRRVPLNRAALDALGASYANLVMVGLPVVTLGWGEPGLALLLSIVALHSLLLLTTATFVFELAAASDAPLEGVARALRAALTHPVIVPILAGTAWNLVGLPRPAAVETALGWLAAAAAPLCLVLLGASLGHDGLGRALRAALAMSAVKLLALPLLAAGVAHFVFALAPLPLTIVVIAAAMPVGANVFLFAQRYRADSSTVAGAFVWSTLLAAPTLAVLLPLLPVPPR